jgi:hypothetical protein
MKETGRQQRDTGHDVFDGNVGQTQKTGEAAQ